MAESIDGKFSQQELDILQMTFSIFDKDRDQKLYLEEAKVALDKIDTKMSQQDFSKLLAMCECVENEKIEFDIFKLMVLKKRELKLTSNTLLENESRLNSREELKELMRELGDEKTDEEFDQMFRGAELNEDDEITLSEYIRILNIQNY